MKRIGDADRPQPEDPRAGSIVWLAWVIILGPVLIGGAICTVFIWPSALSIAGLVLTLTAPLAGFLAQLKQQEPSDQSNRLIIQLKVLLLVKIGIGAIVIALTTETMANLVATIAAAVLAYAAIIVLVKPTRR
jgi:hypothetical protein